MNQITNDGQRAETRCEKKKEITRKCNGFQLKLLASDAEMSDAIWQAHTRSGRNNKIANTPNV